jgi:galactokinase/mevalonate kinase-like predicted kinase
MMTTTMRAHELALQHLVSLPPLMAEQFAELERRPRPDWFAASDPPGCKLGSGGGTAHLLASAWRETGGPLSFSAWLNGTRKLIVHGGGESRRLPAYAAVGKPLMPVPALRWSLGQRLDQTLLDLQLPEYRRVLLQAAPGTVALVASGDVVLQFARELPPFPAVDVLGLGMWVTPEKAKDFGVFFTPRRGPNDLAFFLQKPSPARIRELATDHLYMVDTGMWLLSERAVRALMVRSGWDLDRQRFGAGTAGTYELYGEFGLALGTRPTAADPLVGGLTCAVVPLPRPEFYHFGTSRQMIESLSALQNRELDERKLGLMGARRHPDQYLQNARFACPLRQDANHTLWVENSTVPASWRLAREHVLTGVPANDWDLQLEPGVCLDFVPVGEDDFCVRFYGMDDRFRGPLDHGETKWLNRPAPIWFGARGLDRGVAGLAPGLDLQEAPLFPVLQRAELEPRFLEWLFASEPAPNPAFAAKWTGSRRLAAQELAAQANLRRLYAQRTANRDACLRPMFENAQWSVFLKLDLQATAGLYAAAGQPLPGPLAEPRDGLEPMQAVHEQMFRAAVLRQQGRPEWQAHEAAAFSRLRDLIVREAELTAVTPRCSVQEDQIVWGRSPLRLDLAGGWTDTPPYCFEFGGRVVNVAVDLNGQPPIQVFARMSATPELVVRSIDLGAECRLRTYEELDTFGDPGSAFAVAKAAFALAGFLPRFHAQRGFRSLADQLHEFGGGIELSLLCAVPKGSGLGTSSILSATVLATLGDLCALGWDRSVLFTRTLALEQMLTSGGGWQDQAGGIYRGIKLVETNTGVKQRPTLRWLPDHLFSGENANKTILLYYTGLTRLAKNILHEIVRGIFLNSASHLAILEDIGANAEVAFNAIQRDDYASLAEVIETSWECNQRLDAGTNPPPVQTILSQVGDYLAAAKLLGAGGGGFLLMLAKDEGAARRIRESLTAHPPNPRARFVSLRLSDTGLQLTRS